MRCARNSRNSWVVLALALMLLFSACTIVPKPVRDARASFDGNTANSGFLQFNADGSGRITPHARERYNGLVKLYGAHFTPPLAANAGLVENREIGRAHV